MLKELVLLIKHKDKEKEKEKKKNEGTWSSRHDVMRVT